MKDDPISDLWSRYDEYRKRYGELLERQKRENKWLHKGGLLYDMGAVSLLPIASYYTLLAYIEDVEEYGLGANELPAHKVLRYIFRADSNDLIRLRQHVMSSPKFPLPEIHIERFGQSVHFNMVDMKDLDLSSLKIEFTKLRGEIEKERSFKKRFIDWVAGAFVGLLFSLIFWLIGF